MAAWAEPSNPGDIKHVEGCHGTAGCRCAHYAHLNPPDKLPAGLRRQVEAINSYYDDPCKACGASNCEASDVRCCDKCEHGGACEGCGLPRHPARALGSACRRCGHRMGDGCVSRTDAGEVLKAGDVVRATFSAGLIDKGRKYRIDRVHPGGRIGFVGWAPLLGSPSGYEKVPPAPDPGLPADYTPGLLPPLWTCVELSGAVDGVGYHHASRRTTIYRQPGRSWTILGRRYLADAETSTYEAMQQCLGLDWIGELWTDPEARDRP